MKRKAIRLIVKARRRLALAYRDQTTKSTIAEMDEFIDAAYNSYELEEDMPKGLAQTWTDIFVNKTL